MKNITWLRNGVEISYWANHCHYWLDPYVQCVLMIWFYMQPTDYWEYKLSEFYQGRVLFMLITPIWFYFGQFSKNASNAEKGKLIHQAHKEQVMCYHFSTVKCMVMIRIFYNVNLISMTFNKIICSDELPFHQNL